MVLRAPVASPFGITARLRILDDANAYGLRLLLEDMDGRPRAVDIERRALATMGGTEARGLFLEAGVRFEEDGELIAVAALKAAHPEREISIMRHPGWHDLEGVRVFVAPGGEVIGLSGEQRMEFADLLKTLSQDERDVLRRIRACAVHEFGCEVDVADRVLAVVQIFDDRGHSVSLCYRAVLRGEPSRRLVGEGEQPDPGDLRWFRLPPADLYPSHLVYRDVLAGMVRGDLSSGAPLFTQHVGRRDALQATPEGMIAADTRIT